MTAGLFAGDRIGRHLGWGRAAGVADPWAVHAALAVAGGHFLLLILAIRALSGGAGLSFGGWCLAFLGLSLWFGQVGNAVAHELIHAGGRAPFLTGMWLYISLLYGHHTSAHRLVHHRFVATPDDPNSAALGEGFWSFLARAWPGGFLAGYEMENSLQAASGQPRRGLHPYTAYLAGGAAFILLAGLIGGVAGVLVHLALSAHAQLQLLLSDYVQHYGLQRARTGPDSYEPFGAEHSWDAPDALSGLMMMNAPRHADHHAHPGRGFTELTLSPGGRAPLLPASLPVMATVALLPRLWRRIMDRRVLALREQGQGQGQA